MVSEDSSYDPSLLNDPIATKTQWTPLKSGGSNFRTHKLVMVNLNRYEFKASLGAKLFYLVFFIVGFGVAMIPIYNFYASGGEQALSKGTILPLIFGFVFMIVGGLMLYFGLTPIVFDKMKRYFWKGRKSPEMVYNKSEVKNYVPLDKIHALQLISEHIRNQKSSYYSYELNLVLEDGNRINVIDHGSQDKVREDAHTLAGWLLIPVWDAI
jgi:hypothetical protein